MSSANGRRIALHGMVYGPTNEQGVVFLFGRLATNLGFEVEQVQTHCPDCIATRKGKRHRIEFEYWASHYHCHRHAPDKADIIVCWENDWETRPAKYRHIEIIGLKKYAGALPRVFVVGCGDEENATALRRSYVEWTTHSAAQVGHLVLIYRSMDDHAIHDAWRVVGPFNEYAKRNRQGRWPGLQVGMRCAARFRRPVSYSDFTKDPVTRDLGVVRSKFRGKCDITDDWPLICDRITHLNPKARATLSKWRSDL